MNTTRSLWPILIALVASSGCDLISHPRERASALLARGDLAGARIEATNAIQKDAADVEAYVLLGQILFSQGEFAIAERTLTKAAQLKADPNRTDGLRAEAMLRMRAYARILKELDPTPAHRGETLGRVHAARGQAQLVDRRTAEARRSFDAALAAMPDQPDALIGQAQLAYIEKNPEDALRLVERVLVKAPRHAAAWQAKATFLQLQDRPLEAIAAFDQAALSDTDDITALLSAAHLGIQTQRFDEARKRIEEAARRAPNAILLRLARANLFYSQHLYDEALVSVQEILRTQPQFPPAVVLAAQTHLARGEANQAETLLRPLLRASTNDLLVRKLYVTALLHIGRFKAAMEAVRSALVEKAADPELLSLAAAVATRLQDYNQATFYFEQAAKVHPSRVDMLARAGLARAASGDISAGMVMLERASAESTTQVSADIALATLHFEKKSYAKALAIAEAVQTKAPQNPIGFNLAGLALARLNDPVAAERRFRRALALNPDYWPAVANLVRILVAAGRRDDARARVEQVLAKHGDNVEAAATLMQITGDRGDFISRMEAARREYPRSVEVRLALAQAFLESGQAERAIPLVREAVAIDPARTKAAELLGIVQLAAGRTGEALNTLRDLATRQPNMASIQVRLAETYAALSNVGAAESAYRKALMVKPGDVQATEGLARLYGRTQRFEQALKLASELRDHYPKEAFGFELAGDLYADAKRHPEAINAYEKAFLLRPTGALLIKRYKLRTAVGGESEAATLVQWLNQYPNDLFVRWHIGNQDYAAGRYREAIDHYARIVSADPLHAYAFNNIASAYLKLDDSRALPNAEAAQRLLPHDADILDTLGVAQTRYGDAAEACETLRKAISRRPEATGIRVNYALALAKAGERQAARGEIKRLVESGKLAVLDDTAKSLLETP